jgi:uncharacterized phage protein (TIGR01671 family)
MNNKNKYRFWCNAAKEFITNYKYNGFVDELFDQQDFLLTPQQYIGILDANMKEVYEGDVVRFIYSSNEYKLGVLIYMNDYCAYVIHYDNGYVPIMNVAIDSLEIVGNIMKDYIWNEKGELVKQIP